MKQFFVDIKLPAEFSEKFVAQIPAQHEQIEQMMDAGTIRTYGLSEDQARLYMVLNADNLPGVESILQEFKLYEYFEPQISELMFYKEAPEQFPVISLN
jgi:aryl-alcohol dehydrogenase-like predicted oxidoreductase